MVNQLQNRNTIPTDERLTQFSQKRFRLFRTYQFLHGLKIKEMCIRDSTRIDPNPESDSPVSEAIMDRIIHNAYEVLVDGRVSMRERKGLKAAREGGGQDV